MRKTSEDYESSFTSNHFQILNFAALRTAIDVKTFIEHLYFIYYTLCGNHKRMPAYFYKKFWLRGNFSKFSAITKLRDELTVIIASSQKSLDHEKHLTFSGSP